MTLLTIHLLLKRQLKEDRKTFLIAGLALLGSLSFLYLLIYHWRSSFTGGRQNGIFLIGLFSAGAFIANHMFKDLSDKAKGIWIMTIPATHAEKMLVAVLVSCFLFLPVYTGIFCAVDAVYASLAGEARLDLFKNNFYYVGFSYLTFHGLFLLGSIVFHGNSFLKTLVCLLLFAFLFYQLNTLYIKAITGIQSIQSTTPMDSFQFEHEGQNVYVHLPGVYNTLFEILIKGVLPISLWVIAWLQLKEKEL